MFKNMIDYCISLLILRVRYDILHLIYIVIMSYFNYLNTFVTLFNSHFSQILTQNTFVKWIKEPFSLISCFFRIIIFFIIFNLQ